MPFNTIEDALAALAQGQMIVVVDDEDRENEGDLILAAEHATPESVAFMVRHTSGMLCVALQGDRLDDLGLPMMVERNSDSMQTAYTVTVDYRHGTTTGISAADRSVLQRPGHTEATVDLTQLAGLRPGGVLAEIVNDDGSMARRHDLEIFAKTHGLLIITIADLVNYRRNQVHIRKESEARIPTRHGMFTALVYKAPDSPHEHLAMVMGKVQDQQDVLVRVHSECLTGDTFGSLRCDCRQQLEASLAAVGREGRGVVVYLRGHEGRGIGLTHKLRAYALQDEGLDTVDANLSLGLEADARDYTVGARILQDLGITSMRLLTNNPAKYRCIAEFGLQISEKVPLHTPPTRENHAYLMTKQARMGHTLQDSLSQALT
jgi:3,4-dihydroxy 2-butanone 4-phosphate synthase/GTP cyclohydrolase II